MNEFFLGGYSPMPITSDDSARKSQRDHAVPRGLFFDDAAGDTIA
jgi:hypothetical protein